MTYLDTAIAAPVEIRSKQDKFFYRAGWLDGAKNMEMNDHYSKSSGEYWRGFCDGYSRHERTLREAL